MTPEPKQAVIIWTLEVKAGPGSPITETGKWGAQITVSDLAETATNAEVAMMSAKLLGIQLVESFLVTMGADVRDEDFPAPKNLRVNVEIKERPDGKA